MEELATHLRSNGIEPWIGRQDTLNDNDPLGSGWTIQALEETLAILDMGAFDRAADILHRASHRNSQTVEERTQSVLFNFNPSYTEPLPERLHSAKSSRALWLVRLSR